MAASRTPNGFDGGKFAKMIEPLTVRLDRVRGAGKPPEPVPLPFDGAATKEQVMGLEQWVRDDVGFGDYAAQVTDPGGVCMRWTFAHVNPNQIPATTPVGGPWPHGLTPPSMLPVPSFSPSPVVSSPPAVAGGAGMAEMLATLWQQSQMEMQMRALERFQSLQAGAGGQPMQGSRSGGSEADDLRRKLDEERTARMLSEHKRELDEANRRAAEQIADLRRSIESKPAVDPVLEEMKRQNAELARRLEQQDAARANDVLRAEMQAMAAKFETLVKEMAGTKADPMVEVMREQARAQAESAKAQAEAQAKIAQVTADAQRLMVEKFSSMSTTPTELLRTARELQDNSGSAALMSNLQTSVGAILQLQQQAMRAALEQVGAAQGSPVAGLVAQGINDTKEVIGRYLETRAQREVATARASAQEATARIAEANSARSMATGGFGGTQAPTALPAPAAVPAAAPTSTSTPNSDARAFGPALNAVARLRSSVADGATPEQVIAALVGAMQQFESMRSNIPALALIIEDKFDEFFALLLPATPEEYRAECVQRLRAMFAKQVEATSD